MHEEDYGILWKHADLHGGTTEVRRSRRLVVSFICTVGNYEYGFYWYFYLDGTIQLEVKLTGIMSTMAVEPGEEPANSSIVAPQLAAPYHQHLFNVRLDVDVDGVEQHRLRGERRSGGTPGPETRWRTRSTSPRPHSRPSCRPSGWSTRRGAASWKIVNPGVRNGLGQPVAYKLVPGSTPTLLADPESSVGRRAGFAASNLWVTPYRADERRAAGDHPNQHAGGDGLPAWTAADRPITDTDIVVWHSFGDHAHPPAGGLAGHAGRVRRLPPRAVRVLRPEPVARRAADLGWALRRPRR